MYHYSFDDGITLVISPEPRVNQAKKSPGTRKRKRKRAEQAVSSGRRARRK